MTLLSMGSRSSVGRVPTRCAGGLGFNSCQDSYFVFVPRLYHVDHFTFHISLLSSKFTIFINIFITTHNDFDSTDPSSMQYACHILNDLGLHDSRSSVDRAPA